MSRSWLAIAILPDLPTSRHSYVPQTNRDPSNVIGREVLLPRYFPQTLKKSIACNWSILKMADIGLQELHLRTYKIVNTYFLSIVFPLIRLLLGHSSHKINNAMNLKNCQENYTHIINVYVCFTSYISLYWILLYFSSNFPIACIIILLNNYANLENYLNIIHENTFFLKWTNPHDT